jgi:Ca2+-binding RTX toxin-like protein
MSLGVSQSGSAFGSPHALHSGAAVRGAVSFASGHDIASVKLGGATVAHIGAASSIFARDSGTDRVAASHGGDSVVGGARDTLTGSSGSRALDALRHADSFIGAAGSETYSLGGGVGHDRIFLAGHLLAIPHSGLHVGAPPDALGAAHSGAAAHTLLTLGENTTVSVKDVTPTLGGGHFK